MRYAVIAVCSFVLLLTASVAPATTAATPRPIAFLGQIPIYDVSRGLNNTQTYLNQLAADHFGGYVLDNRYKTLDDDLQNGGVGRMSPTDYASATGQVSSLVKNATALGLTDSFLRLTTSVYCLPCVSVTGSNAKWDIFNSAEVAQFGQTWRNQATFANATGMTGIWFDGEPYGENLWDETQDPTLTAASKTVAQVRQQYYALGSSAASQMVAVNPALQLIVDPLVNNNTGSSNSEIYTYFPDFVAGMISVLATTPGAKPLVIAPENSFAMTSTSNPSFARVYTNVMGSTSASVTNGVPNYYGIRSGIQYEDAQHGTDLWDWHLAHDSVALATEPFSYHNATNGLMWGTPTDLASAGSNTTWLPTFQANLQAITAIGAPYFWVYDNRDAWELASYTCNWPTGTVTTQSQPCPGTVLRDTLPSLLPTPTATATPTLIPTATSTDTPTATSTATDTPTSTPTDTPTDTPTATPTATSTPHLCY